MKILIKLEREKSEKDISDPLATEIFSFNNEQIEQIEPECSLESLDHTSMDTFKDV